MKFWENTKIDHSARKGEVRYLLVASSWNSNVISVQFSSSSEARAIDKQRKAKQKSNSGVYLVRRAMHFLFSPALPLVPHSVIDDTMLSAQRLSVRNQFHCKVR